MHRSSTHITTLIILLSILTITIQFSVYYFFGATLVTFGLITLLILLCSHIFLNRSHSYEACFSYSLLNIFVCFIIMFSNFRGEVSFLIYQHNLLLFIILHWTIPTLYCIIRCLLDKCSKYTNFNLFYRNISIVFLVIYVGVLIYILFLQNGTNILYYTDYHSINLVPFLTLATLIEDHINGYVSVNNITAYLIQGILLFVPYGFYTILLLRYNRLLTRIIALLFLPLLIEVLQRVFLLGKGDIDDIILAMIGSVIGALCYHILNLIFRAVTDDDFLYECSHYSFYNNFTY